MEIGEIHDQLQTLGVDPASVVLIECFPDSGSTHILRFVDRDHHYWEADIDLNDRARNTRELLGVFPRGGTRRMQIQDSIAGELLLELGR